MQSSPPRWRGCAPRGVDGCKRRVGVPIASVVTAYNSVFCAWSQAHPNDPGTAVPDGSSGPDRENPSDSAAVKCHYPLIINGLQRSGRRKNTQLSRYCNYLLTKQLSTFRLGSIVCSSLLARCRRMRSENRRYQTAHYLLFQVLKRWVKIHSENSSFRKKQNSQYPKAVRKAKAPSHDAQCRSWATIPCKPPHRGTLLPK